MHPIGVFDSGIGGLSVLRALRDELPHANFLYIADSGHAPYGERDDAHVIARSHAIADYLVQHHNIRALVVACNTATASAIRSLRAALGQLPIIGIEPALKPAANASKTKVIGVMATRGTLNSEKFRTLQASFNGHVTFILQACDGLADAIEREDATKIGAYCAQYMGSMGRFGIKQGEIDKLVLGCTHYPLLADQLQQLVGPTVELFDAGHPVAIQTARVLSERPFSEDGNLYSEGAGGTVKLFTTGSTTSLQNAVQRWLSLNVEVEALIIETKNSGQNAQRMACPEGIEPPTLSLEG
jgi:glutamate racemase